jgi:adhesin transport system outer membrane protein
MGLLNNKLTRFIGVTGLVCATSAVQADTLEQSVTNAIATHPKLQEALYAYRASRADQEYAKSDYRPSLTLNGGYGYEDTQYLSGSKIDEQLDRREVGVTLSQALFRGFETKYTVKQRGHLAESERYNLISTANETAFEVAEVYLNLLMAEKLLRLAKQNQFEHERIREDIKTKVNSQLAAPADLAQVDARLANTRSSTVAAKNRLFDLKNKYRLIVGKTANTLVEPKPNFDALPPSLESATTKAKQSHYKLLAAKQKTKANNAEYQASKAGYYPDITLELTSNYDEDTGGVPGKDENAAVMLKVDYALYDGGKRSSKKRASAYRYQQAIEQRRTMEREIALEVETAWYAMKLLEEQTGFLQDNVTAALKAEEGYQEQFKVGRRELLDVLISKTETFRARQSYIDAYYRQLIAVYRLKLSTGNLLNAINVEVPQQWSATQ